MKNPPAPAFWWALSWELDRSVSSVALGVFGAMSARGAIALWLAGSRKRTHLLYEIISKQIQHRMSPVRTDSGEAGLGSGAGMYSVYVWLYPQRAIHLSVVSIKAPPHPSLIFYVCAYKYLPSMILKSFLERGEWNIYLLVFLSLLQQPNPQHSSWKFHLTHCCAANGPKIATAWLMWGHIFSYVAQAKATLRWQ